MQCYACGLLLCAIVAWLHCSLWLARVCPALLRVLACPRIVPPLQRPVSNVLVYDARLPSSVWCWLQVIAKGMHDVFLAFELYERHLTIMEGVEDVMNDQSHKYLPGYANLLSS